MATEVNIVELEIKLQENFTKKLENIEKSLDPVQKKLDSMKDNILALTDGLRDMMAAFKLLAGNTANFKQRVTQLNTEMKGLKKSSTDMSASIKKSTTVGISQFNKLQNEVKSLKNDTDNSTRSMATFSKTMKNLKIGALGYTGFRIGKSLLSQASDAQEASNLFNVIFDNMDSNMQEQSENFRTKYGLSTSTYSQAISELGAKFKNLGASTSEAFDLSTESMKNALDISSGYNKSIEESILKVESGISGETEPLKRLGIMVNVDAMNAYAASIGKSYANMDQLERALLRTQKVTEDLKKSNISGDFQRTSNNYAVSLNMVKEQWLSIKEELGSGILPLITDILYSIRENKDELNAMAKSVGNVLGSLTKFFIENSEYLKMLLTIFVTAKAVGGIKFAITMGKDVMAAIKTLGALMGVSTAVVGAGLVLTVGTAVVIDKGVKASKKEQQDVLEGEGSTEITNMYLQSWKDELTNMIRFMNEEGLSIQTVSDDARKRYMELSKKINTVEENIRNNANIKTGDIPIDKSEDFFFANNYAYAAMAQAKELGISTKEDNTDTTDTTNNLLKPLIDSMNKDLKVLNLTDGSELEKLQIELSNQSKMLSVAIDNELTNETDSISNRIKYLKNQIDVVKKEDKIQSDAVASLEKYNNNIKSFKASLSAIDVKGDIFDYTELDVTREKMEKTKAMINSLLTNKDQSLVKDELALLTDDLKNLKEKVKIGDEKKTLLEQGQTLSDNLDDITTMALDFGINNKDTLRAKADAYREYLVGIANNGITDLERVDFDINSKKYTELLGKVVNNSLKDLDADTFESLNKDNMGLNLDELEDSLSDINSIITTIKSSTGDIKLLPEDIQDQLKEAEKVKTQVEELIKPKKEFLNSAKEFESTMNSLAGVFNQLSDITGSETIGNIGSLVSSIGGLGSVDFSAMNMSSMAGIGAMASGASAGLAVLGAVGSFVDSESAKEEERGQEELQKYEDNTSALEALTKTIEQNTENVKTLANNLIQATSLLPTLGNISSGKSIFSGIFEGIEESEKDLGELSIRAKYKKSGGWFSSSSTTYRTNEYSTEDLLTMMGFDSDTANLTFQGLKDFRTSLDSLTSDVLKSLSKGETPKSMIGDFLESPLGMFSSGFLGTTFFGGSYHYKGFTSNIEEYKANLEAFIDTMNQLQTEEAEFFRGSTMESFEGISYVAAKELRTEYEELFDDLGLDTETYSDLIDDMVKQNQVLVTSMQDVRSSFLSTFVEGGVELGSAFISSMSSYFDKIKTNISQIIYDTTFSDITDMGDSFFSQISESLLNSKQGNSTIQEAISSVIGDNSGFFDSLMDMSELEGTMEDYWDIMRQTLVDSGLSKEVIDALLPKSDAAIEWANRLVTAMNSALDNSTFDSFSTSLGESLYNTVKDSLIQAFADSQAYQNLIGNFMEDVDFTGLSFEESFNLIESKMEEFNDELKSQGLEFQAETGATDTVDVIATSTQVEQDTTGATITNNYKYYVIDIDGSYVGVDSIEKMKEIFEADGFIREENTKF